MAHAPRQGQVFFEGRKKPCGYKVTSDALNALYGVAGSRYGGE